ncbi:MAG: sulfurtransferase FdhD, partial [Betaproteobacteria bacterium]|nr:sulfurtransferase FdhD [Betaproteobacteria bacterium]
AGVLTAVSAPTALAVELAQDHNLLLTGLVRGDGFSTYSHRHRLQHTARPQEEAHHGH